MLGSQLAEPSPLSAVCATVPWSVRLHGTVDMRERETFSPSLSPQPSEDNGSYGDRMGEKREAPRTGARKLELFGPLGRTFSVPPWLSCSFWK